MNGLINTNSISMKQRNYFKNINIYFCTHVPCAYVLTPNMHGSHLEINNICCKKYVELEN